MLKHYRLRDYDFRLIFFAIVLSVIGIMVIGSAKKSVQGSQIVGLFIGLGAMVGVSLIDYKLIFRFRRIIYLFAAVMLAVLIFIPELSKNTNGATRWILIGGFQFQPSEICKIMLIVFFSAYFLRHEERINTIPVLLLTVVLFAIPIVLIYKEPDLSTTIITTLVLITLLFLAGLSYKIVIGVLAVAIPAGVITLILIIRRVIVLKDYQFNRIMSWINPEKYADNAYQQQNSIRAIGSGQILGKGLNNNSIVSLKNGNFISEPQTDFIFTIVGEELGFIGCMVIIILLLIIAFECIRIAFKAQDLGGRLLCAGIACLITYQSFMNIAVTTGIMPNTGIPLPFVSYGQTSLISLYIGLGMVLNVGLQSRKRKSEGVLL